MWDIGWRSIAVGLVFLLDLIVFADLVRAELYDLRATWVVIKRGPRARPLEPETAAESPRHQRKSDHD